MKKQDYSNHVRYYTPHHFVFYPVAIAGICLGIWGILKYPDQKYLWIAITLLFCLVACLSFMMRQHYALNNQNRVVRLELRLRYYQLTGQRLEPLEQKLSLKQLSALRFASDEELPGLIHNAITENLSPDAIKKSIRNWLPDEMRV